MVVIQPGMGIFQLIDQLKQQAVKLIGAGGRVEPLLVAPANLAPVNGLQLEVGIGLINGLAQEVEVLTLFFG